MSTHDEDTQKIQRVPENSWREIAWSMCEAVAIVLFVALARSCG